MYESTKITLLTSVILLTFFDGSALDDSSVLLLFVFVSSEKGALKASFSFWSYSFLSFSSAAAESSEGPDSLSSSWVSLAKASCLVGLCFLGETFAFSELSSTAAEVID
jgi:hypothetical protein